MGFSIVLDFKGGLSKDQQEVFDRAARRWEEIISGTAAFTDLQLKISARGPRIDGEGAVLGQAGPTFLRLTDGLPLAGSMEFDQADLKKMESEGTLQSIILHEMAHVIGIGTLWERKNLLTGQNTKNPLYTGANAVREYDALLGKKSGGIPVANTGGPGTALGHWRESVFQAELMTGYAEKGGVDMPVSRMTVAALQDLGWSVNYDKADDYRLPDAATGAVTGLEAEKERYVYCKSISPKKVKVEGYEEEGRCRCCML
jgi:hypothetical protein